MEALLNLARMGTGEVSQTWRGTISANLMKSSSRSTFRLQRSVFYTYTPPLIEYKTQHEDFPTALRQPNSGRLNSRPKASPPGLTPANPTLQTLTANSPELFAQRDAPPRRRVCEERVPRPPGRRKPCSHRQSPFTIGCHFSS